jgi:cell division septation protein DedD
MVQRLTGKGYEAYILDPAPGAPTTIFRVRVGRYADRSAAEQTRLRLEREEQFKPWITR